MIDQQAYAQKLKGRIEEFSAEIDKLKAKARQSTAEAQIEIREKLELLKAWRDDLVRRVDAIQAAGEDSWEDLRGDAQKALEALTAGLSEAKEQVSKALRSN